MLFFFQKRVLSDIGSRRAMYFEDMEISIVYTLSIYRNKTHYSLLIICPHYSCMFFYCTSVTAWILSLLVTREVGLVKRTVSPTVGLMSHAVSLTVWLMSHAVSTTVGLMNLVVSPTVGLANPVVSLTVGLISRVICLIINPTLCTHISPTIGLTVSSTSTYVITTASGTTQGST